MGPSGPSGNIGTAGSGGSTGSTGSSTVGGLLPGESFGFGQSAINSDVANVSQFSPLYQIPANSAPFWQKSPAAANPGVLDAFFGKIGSVLGEAGHMVEGASSWVARQLGSAVTDVVNLPAATYRLGMDTYHTFEYSSQQNNLMSQLTDLNAKYRSGAINNTEYQSQLADWTKANSALATNLTGLSAKIGSDGGTFAKDTIGTASDIVMVMTAGLSSPLTMAADQGSKDVATWLMGHTANELMSPVEDAIAKAANSKAVFDALPSYVQSNVKASVTDTFVNVAAHASAPLWSGQVARATAGNLLIKYPLSFNYLSGTGNQVYKEFQSGKYGDAVKTLGFNAALLLAGGPIGQALKYGGKAAKEMSGKIFGSSSFLDTLSGAIGDKNPAGLFNTIQGKEDVVKAFQALEATNLAAEDGRVGSAAYRIINGLKMDGWNLDQMSHQQFVNQIMGWHIAQSSLTDALVKSGMSEAEASKYVVGRWSAYDANRVAGAITTGSLAEGESSPGLIGISNGTPSNSADMLKNWEQLKERNPNQAFANNENLDKQITNIIKTSDNVSEANDRIRAISAQTGNEFLGLATKSNGLAEVAQKIGRLGYIPIAPSKLEAPFIQGTQKLVTSAGEGEFFQKAVQPLPVLGGMGAYLTRLGLSPTKSEQSVSQLFNAHFAENLQETSLKPPKASGQEGFRWAQTQYRKLTDYVNQQNEVKYNLGHPPITDLRQMTKKEIGQALSIDDGKAAEVQKALMQSMLDLSWSERGLGSKLIDYIGQGTMQKYLRVQGAGRFAWNPFFKMKLGYKTEFLSQLESGGKAPTFLGTNKALRIIFPDYYNKLDSIGNMLKERGMYGSGFSNEAANEASAGYNDLTAVRGMTRTQQLSIAGLVNSMADKTGMTVSEFTDSYPNQVRDTIESILHYNPNASFLNSPLARTLNFAFFPFRFNLKVASFMAKGLARQDSMTQVAVIHSMIQAHQFLTSEQGQAWYSQNSDVLGLLTYFSPLETLSAVAALGNIGHESVGSFGELGGLPVGFISQILQAEGMLNTTQSYVNPKTGQPGTQYIPLTMKAKLATAISSFIGSLFTYPGSEAGLPSKTGLLAKASEGVTGSKTTDWQKAPETNLTPQQQQFEQAVQQLQKTTQAAPQLSSTPASNFNEPITGNATATPYYKKTGSSTPPATKLKKAQEPVQLLPGQTTLGQT